MSICILIKMVYPKIYSIYLGKTSGLKVKYEFQSYVLEGVRNKV